MAAPPRRFLRTLGEGAAIVLIGCAAGALNNALSARGIPLVGQWRKAYGVPSPGGKHAPTHGNVEINLAEALRLHAGGALFLDARPATQFATGPIPAARSLPEDEFEERVGGVIDDAAGALAVVTYCQGMECDEGHLLARKLRGAGVGRVVVFAGGVDEWKAAGHPLETGKDGRDDEQAG